MKQIIPYLFRGKETTEKEGEKERKRDSTFRVKKKWTSKTIHSDFVVGGGRQKKGKEWRR